MAIFRKALGTLKRGLSKTRETFVASLRSMLSGKQLNDELIKEIEKRLIQSDVGVAATKILIDGINADYKAGTLTKGEDVIEYLKTELKAMWPAQDRTLNLSDTKPTVILMTGVNGVGKTTSISKLCKQLTSEGNTVLLGACDTFRAGAVRQLEIWGERLGVEVVKGQQGGDPAAVAFDACSAAKSRDVDILIIDTAGRLQTQTGLMDQLSKI
ncbi:MAG: signal recognition particle receptor subunit alpha, partial [Phycisphaerales bacterium]|nr:signal recognition particle receptor subunit alpha [Phycisphaerales bacterium]